MTSFSQPLFHGATTVLKVSWCRSVVTWTDKITFLAVMCSYVFVAVHPVFNRNILCVDRGQIKIVLRNPPVLRPHVRHGETAAFKSQATKTRLASPSATSWNGFHSPALHHPYSAHHAVNDHNIRAMTHVGMACQWSQE